MLEKVIINRCFPAHCCPYKCFMLMFLGTNDKGAAELLKPKLGHLKLICELS